MNVFLMSGRQQHGRDRTLDTRDEQKSRENKIIFFPPQHLECAGKHQSCFILNIPPKYFSFENFHCSFVNADEFCIPRGVSKNVCNFLEKYKQGIKFIQAPCILFDGLIMCCTI